MSKDGIYRGKKDAPRVDAPCREIRAVEARSLHQHRRRSSTRDNLYDQNIIFFDDQSMYCVFQETNRILGYALFVYDFCYVVFLFVVLRSFFRCLAWIVFTAAHLGL